MNRLEKKGVSDSPEPLDFAVTLGLPIEQVKFEEIQIILQTEVQEEINIWGLVRMTFGRVHHSK